jgi:hypothetical protein
MEIGSGKGTEMQRRPELFAAENWRGTPAVLRWTWAGTDCGLWTRELRQDCGQAGRYTCARGENENST